MRKCTLTAVLLLFGAFAFAQVTTETGDADIAEKVLALPGAAGTANTGESIQTGDDNKVRVRQAGENQSAKTVQGNGSGDGGNLAQIMQTGDVAGPTGSGYLNLAEVNQSGTANQSTTIQQGNENNAITDQGQGGGAGDDASRRNRAFIQQGDNNQAEFNFAAIEQDGNVNRATIFQTYDKNEAFTRQDGSRNKSMIVQKANPNDSEGHEAWNQQEGNRNQSSIDQAGAKRNDASTQQFGNRNRAKQKQTTTGDKSSSDVGHYAAIQQGWDGFGDFYPTIIPATTVAAIISYFVDNEIVENLNPRMSIGARAKQTQTGDNQHAEIVQWGGARGNSNYAEQIQSDGNNYAVIGQDHDGDTDGTWNYAKQDQDGQYNGAALFQVGNSHKAYQTQYGDGNIAFSTQVGEHNLLNIHQRGDNNTALTRQNGTDNVALVVQQGGQSYSVLQGAAYTPAMGNQADILQLGPSGDFSTDAINCTFGNKDNLRMDYSVDPVEWTDICPDC